MAPVYADHPFALLPDPRTPLKAGEKQDLFDEIKGIMACAHNTLIRGLNAIYLQAPHIQPADHLLFARFAHQWFRSIDQHHGGEETHLFPGIEKVLDAPGVLEPNIEQHRAFHDGLHEFGEYTEAVAAGKTAYDGARLVAIIDSFAPPLMTHLADELVSLEGLRRFGAEKFAGARKVMEEEEKEMIKQAGMSLMLYIILLIDEEYEDGRWSFPPVPGFFKFILRSISSLCLGYMKFAPIDRHGCMKPLYAVPKE